MTDAIALRNLADWFDEYDKDRGIVDPQVQNDLRRIADEIDAAIGNYADYPLSKETSEILTAEVERRTIKAESFSAENGVKVLMFWYKTN